MTMWIVIMWTGLILTGAALVYLSTRVCRFNCIRYVTKENEKRKALVGGGIVFGAFAIIAVWLNFMNAIVCAIYFALVWLICDLVFGIIQKLSKRVFKCYYSGAAAVILSVAALVYGWYLNHNVWATTYNITTEKNIKPMKIVMFADSHLGTTFDASGFAEHVAKMQAENPDIVIVAGDFVDDGTKRADMVKAAELLGNMRVPYGVYFVFGNHDNGYYGAERRGFSGAELVKELEKNGVFVLRDEAVSVDGLFYMVGRRDYSVEREQRGTRKSMAELTADFDKAAYAIVADHQPADYKNQADSEVDLVLSGHTHGGQLFPFNQVGKWIGANDRVYGYEKRGKTSFIVTSGLSDWAIKFKTGTKSEYVVINLQPKAK